jgi:RNA polymerase sigma factor (sigma-70 family)
VSQKTRNDDRVGESCARRVVPFDAAPRGGGDRLALLYAEHAQYIGALCLRLLGDRASAEDATHEAFLRAGRWVERLPPPSDIRPWLFRIATNCCLNELRRRSVRARTPPQLVPLPASAEEAMVARNDARRLLAALPPRTRAIALLTYVDGMLQREVAETLGISRRTVVNCLTRVRALVMPSSRSKLGAPPRTPQPSPTA